MTFMSTSGAIQHFFAGNTNFGYAMVLASGTVLGAQVAAYASKKISNKNLRRVFGLVVFIVGIQIISKFL
jgi:uncharacterized membrane protein YfcA